MNGNSNGSDKRNASVKAGSSGKTQTAGVKKKKKSKIKRFFRKLLGWVIIFIIIMIPSVIGYNLIKGYLSDDLRPDQLQNVTLGYNGGSKTFDEEAEMRFYTELIKNASKISDPAQMLDDYSRISLTFRKLVKNYDYSLYMSDIASDCLLADSSGELYRIRESDALQLLMMDELDYIYKNISAPSFSVSCGGRKLRMFPYSYVWNYRIADGEYRVIESGNENSADISDTAVMNESNHISVTFGTEPDWISVKLTDRNGVTVFENGSPDTDAFIGNADAMYRAEITAEWYEDKTGKSDAKRYHGKLVLVFNAFFDREAICTLSSMSAYPGEYIVIKLKNAAFEDFGVETDIDTAEDLEFTDVGDTKYMLFPVACENKAGKKTLTVKGSYGFKAAYQITISEKTFDTLTLDSSKYGCTPSQYVNYYTGLKKILDDADSATASKPLWNGKFVYPTGDKETWIDTRFGALWTLLGTNTVVRNIGITYAANGAGTKVAASNDGKVVFAGENEISGKMIIIDHGLGLQTVYYHLERINVSVGENVIKGQNIGTLGKSGFAPKYQLMFAFRVNGMPVNPYYFCNEEIKL